MAECLVPVLNREIGKLEIGDLISLGSVVSLIKNTASVVLLNSIFESCAECISDLTCGGAKGKGKY